jgi:phytoene desaturase
MSTQPVVVIGAGFGGLAAAIRLRARGYPVVVLEANEQAGGRASVFERGGFSFDAGPTVVTAPYLLEELFAEAGRDMRDYLELMPVDPFYRVAFPGGESFDYVGEEDRTLDQIRAFNPRDVDGYKKLAAHAERIFDIGYTELADTPFTRVSDMLRVVPDLIKLKNYKTVYQLVSDYIEDERLRQVFTFQPLLVGGNPFKTTSIYMLIHWLERKWGVHFPKGGTASIVRALVQLLDELGVEVRTNTPVAEIEVERGRATAVRTASGERIACQAVVANADPSTVYRELIDKKARSKHSDRRVARVKQSMSLFVAYFGTKKKYDDIAHHTISLGPRYKGLLTDIFDKRVLADDFSLYLHRPTASDPNLAPEGHDGFYVLSPVPNQRSGIDWAETHDRYKARIYDFLEERHLPGLKENLVVDFAVDPRYFEGRLRSTDGAAFGPEPIFQQSAWFRYHNMSEDVGDLYFVGAGTHPGAGVPGVLCSAKVLEHVMPAPAQPIPLPARARSAA